MALRTILRKFANDATGSVLPISAAGILVMVALTGSALDLSVSYMARGKLQNACDAAVLAARQSMAGTEFTTAVEAEADRFFDYNFPAGTAGATGVNFNIAPKTTGSSELVANASATVPTTLVRVIGIDYVPISVNCDATQDVGHNDIVLVLDVTGSMNDAPSNGTGTKIERLRAGASGLYTALETDDGSITRFGIVPYSHTVNVARRLLNRDILTTQWHLGGSWTVSDCASDGYYIWSCSSSTVTTQPTTGFYWSGWNQRYRYITDIGERQVHISDSRWSEDNGYAGNKGGYRTSGEGCIEERPTIDPDNPAPTGEFIIRDYVTRADIDSRATSGSDTTRQFGRYDIDSQSGYSQTGCPSEAQRLRQYADLDAFETAINTATANVTGGTYHDVGMLWGVRFASRTGFFAGSDFSAGDNVTEISGIPVNTHIVFMTDGRLDTGETLYSAHGVERFQDRTRGTGTQRAQHIARFQSACAHARQMGITVWVIALDVTDTSDISTCATSSSHFFTSDGSNLHEVFEAIGQGIGNLRLTR